MRVYKLGSGGIFSVMKKSKPVRKFFFKDLSNQEMVDLLNKEYPVNLKYNEDLVNRVYDKYPHISKTEVAIIIKTVFQSFRDLLVLGKVLSFNNLFYDTKLFFFAYHELGHILPSLRVRLFAPPELRKND